MGLQVHSYNAQQAVTKTLLLIYMAFQKLIVTDVQLTDLISVFYILLTVHLATILGK